MALKAGREGLNPKFVDPVDGSLIMSEAGGYTKDEADAKFETKTDAADLQPKTLAVPIHMLNGTVLTVEGMFAGDQGAKTNKELTDGMDKWVGISSVVNGMISFSSIDDTDNCAYKLFIDVSGSSTNKNPTAEITTISGTGTNNMAITYSTDADSGAAAKLRQIR